MRLKSFLGTRIWVPKPVYWSPKCPVYVTDYPVSLLSVVIKVFEKLVNNRLVHHQEKCSLFSDFQYGFRSCQ